MVWLVLVSQTSYCSPPQDRSLGPSILPLPSGCLFLSLCFSFYPSLIALLLAGYQPLSPSGRLPGSLPGTHLASLFQCLSLSLFGHHSKYPSISPDKHKTGMKSEPQEEWTILLEHLAIQTQEKPLLILAPTASAVMGTLWAAFRDPLPLHDVHILNAQWRQALGIHAKAIWAAWKIQSLTSGWTKKHWKF